MRRPRSKTVMGSETSRRLSPAAAHLAHRFAVADEHSAVEIAAQFLLKSGGLKLSAAPGWNDLKAIGEVRQITALDRTPSGAAGMAHLTVGSRGFTAHVRKSLSRGDFRISFAHEIAHTLFFDLEATPPRRRIRWTGAEERICDSVARAVAMPWDWLARVVHSGQWTEPWEATTQIRKETDCSLWDACSRLVESGLTLVRVATRWRRDADDRLRLFEYARAPHETAFVPLRKTAIRPGTVGPSRARLNDYVWDLLYSYRWSKTLPRVELGGLRGEMLVVGRAVRIGDECVALYC